MNTKKILETLFDKDKLYVALAHRKLIPWDTDERYLKHLFKVRMGKKLDLKNPQTYNEKLQWLKLYDRKPEYTTMVDKYEVKKYVADKIGDEYIIPTLGVWDNFDDIDFEKLPNQFVLKCTHDSGGLVICKDKSKLDINAAKNKINKSLKQNYYYSGREWPYKNVKPRIIAEKYMVDEETNDLRDYKFFCFDGKAKMMYMASNRFNNDKETTMDYFDEDFNWLDINWGTKKSDIKPSKPNNFEEMISIAERLSKDIPEVRIDLYYCNKQIYFGEITFFDGSGFNTIKPIEWDYKLGSYIKLPIDNK